MHSKIIQMYFFDLQKQIFLSLEPEKHGSNLMSKGKLRRYAGRT